MLNLKRLAIFRVTDEIGVEQNIARAKNGYDYPKAEAQSDPGSNDRIEAIHDDVSYTEKSRIMVGQIGSRSR